MSLGMTEIVILLVIALLFFGPSRLPGLGKSLGEAIRGFKKGLDAEPESEEINESRPSQANSRLKEGSGAVAPSSRAHQDNPVETSQKK